MLTVLDGGLSTTIQDLGRPGYYATGVPPSGAMDGFAHVIGNSLVGNPRETAALEATLLGPTLRFEREAVVAVTGADSSPVLNDAPVPMWEALRVRERDVLKLGYARIGCRSYIAISGGFAVPLVMGSRSTYVPACLGGFRGRPLKAGAAIPIGTNISGARAGLKLQMELRPEYRTQLDVAVILGPQDDHFTDSGIATFLNSEYRVSSKTDRMASRLIGPAIEVRQRERTSDEGSGPTDIIEDGNAVGAIQIAGGNEPIIMLRDAISTGAYAKIATLITADVETMAQAKPGDKINFSPVSFAEARKRLAERQRCLATALTALGVYCPGSAPLRQI